VRRRKQLQQHSNSSSDASGIVYYDKYNLILQIGLQLLKKGVAENVIQFLNFGDSSLIQPSIGAKEGRNQEDLLDFRFLQAYARKVKANEEDMDLDEADQEKRYEEYYWVEGFINFNRAVNIFGILFSQLKRGERETTGLNNDLESPSPVKDNLTVNQPKKIHPL